MKIAILHPSYDLSNAPFKDYDPACVPDYYLPGHEYTNFQIHKTTAVRQVAEVARMGFDAVINLCDGAWEEDRPGIEVVQALERLGVAFTGAGSAFYDPSREAMKMACHSAGVKFPAYVIAKTADEAAAAFDRLRAPLIVKHPHGYSSVGMTRDSRVTNVQDLRREAAGTIETYGAALIEEFIEGREFTVLVTEPRNASEEAWALQPVEFGFPPGESFKHFDLKWKSFEELETRRLVGDEALAARLRQASILTFVSLGGSGYGRCDIRMDAAGEIYVLEINPNCGVFYPEGQHGSADLCLSNDPACHRGFLEHLLACAIRRRDRARKPWALRFIRDHGFGMFATKALRRGDLVERYEGRPHVLVSRRHVDRHWHGLRRQWFEPYAWPVTTDLHIAWSDNPDDWRPVNHSCDPNTWLDGLDLVARRDIAAGEELTVEYATFCGPAMAPFECHCGAPDCRRVILGSDHLLPAIRERYGDHVSDFVRAAWHNTAPDWRPQYEIVQNSFGFGVVARRAWRASEAIGPLEWGRRLPVPGRWTVQVGLAEHAEPAPFELRYVNHSCAPNVQFDVDAGVVRALADIEPGDELCAFYPATEWDMAERFTCLCNAVDCLGVIGGAAQTDRETLTRHELSSFIRKKLT
jgi:D-alanine-D-alanine ligase